MSIEIRPTTAVADFATVVSGLLDQVSYDEMVLLTDRKQLDLVTELLTVQTRLAGVVHTVLGAVDRAEAAMTAHGIPTVTLGCGQRAIHTVDEELDIPEFHLARRIAMRLATA